MRAVLVLAIVFTMPTALDATFVITPDDSVTEKHLGLEAASIDNVIGPFDLAARAYTRVSKIEDGKSAARVAHMFFDFVDADESGDLDANELENGLFDGSRLDYENHSDLSLTNVDMDAQDVLAFVGAWDRDDSATLDGGEARDTSLRNQFSATSMLAMKRDTVWKCISGAFTDVASCSNEMKVAGCKGAKLGCVIDTVAAVAVGIVLVVGCAAGKIIDGFVTVFTTCWRMLVQAVADAFGSIASFFTAAFADCDSLKGCLDCIINCGIAILKWLGKMIEDLIMELLGPFKSGYVLVKNAVIGIVKLVVEVVGLVIEIVLAIAKFVMDSVSAIAKHMSALPNLCTPPGYELPWIDPTDCSAFSYVGKIFVSAEQLSFGSIGPNFDAAVGAFGDCLMNTGLWGIPSPFMFMHAKQYCIWTWLQVLIKCVVGTLLYFICQIIAVVNGCESESDQDAPLCALVMDITEVGSKMSNIFAGDASFFESGSDANKRFMERRGYDATDTAPGHDGDFSMTLEFGGAIAIDLAKFKFARSTPVLGMFVAVFIFMFYFGFNFGVAFSDGFLAFYVGFEVQFRFIGNQIAESKGSAFSASMYVLVGFSITTNKMKTPPPAGNGTTAEWCKWDIVFRLVITIENFLGSGVEGGIMLSVGMKDVEKKAPPIGFSLVIVGGYATQDGSADAVPGRAYSVNPKRYKFGPFKQQKRKAGNLDLVNFQNAKGKFASIQQSAAKKKKSSNRRSEGKRKRSKDSAEGPRIKSKCTDLESQGLRSESREGIEGTGLRSESRKGSEGILARGIRCVPRSVADLLFFRGRAILGRSVCSRQDGFERQLGRLGCHARFA